MTKASYLKKCLFKGFGVRWLEPRIIMMEHVVAGGACCWSHS